MELQKRMFNEVELWLESGLKKSEFWSRRTTVKGNSIIGYRNDD